MPPRIGEQLREAADSLPFVKPLHDMATTEPLAALNAVQHLRAVLDDAEALAVVVARSRRLTWREIADPLGLPQRTAHRHFHHLDVV